MVAGRLVGIEKQFRKCSPFFFGYFDLWGFINLLFIEKSNRLESDFVEKKKKAHFVRI